MGNSLIGMPIKTKTQYEVLSSIHISMKENPVLEENQLREFSDVVATYQFTCEGGGAVSKYPSPKLTVRKAGIRLHFLRRGLFYQQEESISFVTKSEQGSQNIASLQGIHFDQFIIGNRSLRTGYLYIFDDSKKNLWFEYQIDELGLLSSIYWADNKHKGVYKDVRTKTRGKERFKIFDQGTVVWVAFSSVQWSVEYHQSMLEDLDKRAKHMKKVVCTGFEKGASTPYSNVYPYHEIIAGFTANEKPQEVWFEQKLSHIEADEEDSLRPDNLLEDMFIVLDDAIGCAEDISAALSKEYIRLDALVESLQTGENPDTIFDRMLCDEEREHPFNEEEKQLNALFSNALTIYQLLYNQEDDKYHETTDKARLMKVLGVAERKQQKKVIEAIRNDFGRLMNNDYYDDCLEHFLKDKEHTCFEGKSILAKHLSLLSVNPWDIDRCLDLKKDYQPESEYWIKCFNDILCNGAKGAILGYIIDIDLFPESYFDHVDTFVISRRFIRVLEGILDAFAKHATREGNFEIILNYFKILQYRGEASIQVNKSALFDHLMRLNLDFDIKAKIEQGKVLTNKTGQPGKKYIRLSTNKNDIRVKHIEANTARITLKAEKKGNKASKVIMQVLNSPRFRAFMMGLELVNVSVGVDKFSRSRSTKNLVATVGAVSHLTSAAADYRIAKLAHRKSVRKSSEKGKLATLSRKALWLGSAINITISIWDAVESYRLRDYDAALAFAAVSAVNAVLLANAAFMFYTGAAGLLFWPLAVLFLLFWGLLFLAIYLTDSPLELFLKNTIFNALETYSPNDQLEPYRYSYDLYKNRNSLISEKCKRWRNMLVAMEDLYDLLIRYRVRKVDMGFSDIPNRRRVDEVMELLLSSSSEMQIGSKLISSFSFIIECNNFQYDTSQLEYELLFLPEGLSNPYRREVLGHRYIKHRIIEGIHQMEINFDIPKPITEQIKPFQSEYLFISRLHISKSSDEYWPIEKDKERYLAYLINPIRSNDPIHETTSRQIDYLWGKEMFVGTIQEIYCKANWFK